MRYVENNIKNTIQLYFMDGPPSIALKYTRQQSVDGDEHKDKVFKVTASGVDRTLLLPHILLAGAI